MRPLIIAPSILSADFRRLGEDAIVAGSAIFGAPDYAAAITAIRENCRLRLSGSLK